MGRDSRREILSVSVAYHNTGKTEIDIAADALNVWGIRFGPRDIRRAGSNHGGRTRTYLDTMPEISHRLIASFSQLREAAQGGLEGVHNVVEPGATTTDTTVIALRRGAYDLVEAQIVAVPVKLHQSPVRVDVVAALRGGTFLRPDPNRAFEDDGNTDFALTP
ncbi:MAG: hypothetical protein GIW94_05215 [Candidatus Eremiobacteraeota bacterium]|nr:hypothetical protein [Candidatus Eremiobacteraeota bacterium]MBC5821354.1 hypothetical protein [Candidatus Eremiobacteraeota bacterium]